MRLDDVELAGQLACRRGESRSLRRSAALPDAEFLWDMADQEGITVFGTSAKYLALLEKVGAEPRKTHKLSKLKAILSTGSPLADNSFDYVYRKIKTDVHLASISGGSDIISCFVLGNPIMPVYRGEIQTAGLGMAVDVFDDRGRVRLIPGELVCTRPFPSMPVAFWDDPDGSKYRAAYFEYFPGSGVTATGPKSPDTAATSSMGAATLR